MNPREGLDPRILESLSAYLDGNLDGAERAALEKRLTAEEDLRRHLAELRAVRESLRSLPVLKPPRPLALSPAQAGVPARRPAAFAPRTMAWGSALAALAFAAVMSVDVLSRGSFAMGAATQAMVLEAMKAPEPAAADSAGPGAANEAGPAAPTLPPATALPSGRGFEQATSDAPAPKAGSETPLSENTAAWAEEEGCGIAPLRSATQSTGCVGTVESVDEPRRFRITLPSFQTAAPYLEAFLGATAVFLAALAVILRRPR